jgi:hypothetical protein
MTPTSNARLAGFSYLLYIAAGITSMVVFGRATQGAVGNAAKLASIAQRAGMVRATILLGLVMFVCAVVLGVTLWALTRDVDPDLAMFAMACRLSEGVVGAVSIVGTLQLISVATASTDAASADASVAAAFGGLLLSEGSWTGSVAATCFALGSTIFCYLFLRARSIPVWLAWLGLFASVVLLVLIPGQLAGLVSGPVAYVMWLPMLVFELTFALWLIIKGVLVKGVDERRWKEQAGT